jgi:hypothetical protein
MTTGTLLLFSYIFLSMGIFDFDGLYSIYTFAWMLLSFTALLMALRGYMGKTHVTTEAPTEQMLAGALVFLLYIAMFKLPGTPDVTSIANEYNQIHMILIALFAAFFLYIPTSNTYLKYLIAVAAIALALVLKVWMIDAAPAPQIDVFSSTTHAVESFLRNGKSPYTPDSSGIVPLHYPPVNFYLHLFSYGLFGDVRVVYILAEMIFALFLWLGGRRFIGSMNALLLACLFLHHPRSLYILELAWTEPPILAFLAASVFFMWRGNKRTAAILYGLGISMKQYLVFFLLHWFLLEKRWSRFVLVIAAGFVTVLPFLLLAPEYLIQHGFLQTIGGDVRFDSLTFVTFWYRTTGLIFPKMISLVVGAIVSVLSFRALRTYSQIPAFLFSSAVTTFSIFLFGGQAFANYYYVVGGILLLLIAYHTHEERLSD